MHPPASNVPPLPPSPSGVLVPSALVVASTIAAFASHALFGAPGDHPGFLLAVGCVLAFAVGASRKVAPVVAGFASSSGFAVEALFDLALRGGHDLLPIEFAAYAVYGLLGVLLAKLGRSLAVRVAR